MQKTRKIFSVVLCCVILAFYSFPTLAAVICHHPSTVIGTEIFRGYSNVTPSGHTEHYDRTYVCADCHIQIGDTVTHTFSIGHKYNRYDNLGHLGMYGDGQHKYRIFCPCGYSQEVTIPCTSSSGHVTPF